MLYLQYNNIGHMDGGGAQTHRKLAIYSLAVKNGIRYIDAPLIGVITPSFSPEVESRPEVLFAWNQLTEFLPKTGPKTRFVKKFSDPWLNRDLFRLLLLYNNKKFPLKLTFKHLFNTHARPFFRHLRNLNFSYSFKHFMRAFTKTVFFSYLYRNRDCVLTITEPFHVVKSGDDYLFDSISLSDLKMCKQPIKIGIHVRRGDLSEADFDRYLPDEYYVKVLRNLTSFLSENGIRYTIEYYVDFPKANNYYQSRSCQFSWGFVDSTETYSINIEDDALALKSLATSDVIIGSKSSYSFVAGLLSKALVIQPRWWIENPSAWITVELDNLNCPILESWEEGKRADHHS